ncbi:MAG: 50S ribosomal protein L25 [Planctomycetota bacterium]|nr:50S ribosomal protein L25 [Planctomycetota bacterium]
MSATIHAELRVDLGTRHAKRLRRGGSIPASIQGEGKAGVAVSIQAAEFLVARRHHEHLFELEIGGGKGKRKSKETALIRELQWDTFGEEILHVEFRRVVLGKKTEVDVELEFTGHPKGGVLNHLMTHIKVIALPQDIPDGIPVKVDGMEPGHTLHASDLELPENVELAIDLETAIANVTVPRGIEEAVPEAEEAAEEGAPVEEGAPGEAGAAEEVSKEE